MQFVLQQMTSKYSETGTITKVGEIMTERLETINFLNTTQEAAVKMADKNVSSLAVIDDNGKVTGIVTERDLARKVCTKNIPSSAITIQNIMSVPVKTVSPDTPIDETADVMVSNRLRHLIVADANNEPIGIVSATDIVGFIRENNLAKAQTSKEILEALEREGRYY
jgi:signal-transduction protein with cAMP-binding, CBS, and nucleotidyltransferase domain